MPKQWLKVGLFSLILSGFFSAVIVFARAPGFAELISDPNFARKSLVLHVDYALIIWFYAFLSVLYLTFARRLNPLLNIAGLKLVIIGAFMMIIPVFIRGVEPILANYIPVLDHPLFLVGLFMVAAGFCCAFLNPGLTRTAGVERDRPTFYSSNAAEVIRSAGIVVLIAVATIVTSYLITPGRLHQETFFELVMWGGGHILQFANVLGMLTVWMILLKKLTGKELVSDRINRWLVLALALPAVVSPVLLIQGTTTQLYYSGFTQLMRWFIFPVVTLYLILGIMAIWRSQTGRRREQKNHLEKSAVIRSKETLSEKMQPGTESGRLSLFRNLYFNGFLVSALLTVVGFILGAMIRGSSTLIPAHYHASLGGVTVAYMVMVFILLREYGFRLDGKKFTRLTSLQPLLFGLGQVIFVIGFAWAGMTGMGRKLFGQDQSIYTVDAVIGLGLMAVGGLLAIAGGLLFIYLIVKSYTLSQKS